MKSSAGTRLLDISLALMYALAVLILVSHGEASTHEEYTVSLVNTVQDLSSTQLQPVIEASSTVVSQVSMTDFTEVEASHELELVPEYNSENPYIELTDNEMTLFAQLVTCEGGIESLECQKAIASVVMNRMTNNDLTLSQVICQPGQFSTASYVESTEFYDSAMEAVKHVTTYGPTIPQYVTFFRIGHYHNGSSRYVAYQKMDHTYFSYDSRVKERLEANESV